MMLANEVETLRRCEMFRNIDPAKLKLLAFTNERLTYLPGEALFTQGEASDAVYVVLNGEVEAFRSEGSRIVPVGVLGVGSIVGEVGVMCDHDRAATVKARSKTCVLRIGRQSFIDMMRECPQFSLAVSRWLAALVEKMIEQSAEPVCV